MLLGLFRLCCGGSSIGSNARMTYTEHTTCWAVKLLTQLALPKQVPGAVLAKHTVSMFPCASAVRHWFSVNARLSCLASPVSM